ncbi:caspase domain-containing protein [Mycena galericulata]|nr:caspase domain-containing protein [Mycena galericulata]
MGGKIKALFIGCTYNGTTDHIPAPKYDAQAMRKFIEEHYQVHSSRILHEDRDEPKFRPTKQNILNALKWLIKDIDTDGIKHVLFYFSGHGGQRGHGTHICPSDYKKNGNITAHDLRKELIERLGSHHHFTAFFDHCHSGNSLAMPYLYKTPHDLNHIKHTHHAAHGHNKKTMPVVFCFGASNVKLVAHCNEKMSYATKAFIEGWKDNATVLDVYRAISKGEPAAEPEFSTSLEPAKLKTDIKTHIPFLLTHRHW